MRRRGSSEKRPRPRQVIIAQRIADKTFSQGSFIEQTGLVRMEPIKHQNRSDFESRRNSRKASV